MNHERRGAYHEPPAFSHRKLLPMKKSVRDYIIQRYKTISFDEERPRQPNRMLDYWPDLKRCVEYYYEAYPEMHQYHGKAVKPIEFLYYGKFIKSLNKYCKTIALKTQFIDALTKIVYRIPSGGLCDKPIRERTDLWHFYVSNSWRVFYRKKKDLLILEEICPHKKLLYPRRY